MAENKGKLKQRDFISDSDSESPEYVMEVGSIDQDAASQRQNRISAYTEGYMKTLAERSKEIRTELGLSQSDVARALHVTRGFVSNVENGRVSMSMKMMIYYAGLMHCSLDELAGLTDRTYQSTALDHSIMEEVSKMSVDEKQKLLDELRRKKGIEEKEG